MQGRQWRGWGAEGAIALRDSSRIEGAAGQQRRRPALILVQYPPSFYWRPWQTVDNSRKTQEDRISLQSSKTHASFLPFFAMCLWYKVILSGANARWKKKKPSSEDSLLWWCSHKKSLQFFSFTFPCDINVPYARHYNLLPTPFLKSISLFSRRYFQKILSLCMVSSQGRVVMEQERKFHPKLCNQVPSLSLSRWRTLILLKM